MTIPVMIATVLCCLGQPARADDNRLLITVYRTQAVEFRDWQIETIKKYLRDPRQRKRLGAREYPEWSTRMRKGLEQLEGSEAPKLFFGYNFGHMGRRDHDLAIGMMGYLRAVDVVQIQSNDEMLVRHDDTLLWIRGLDNSGLTDGVAVLIPDLMVVAGRKTYPTAMGSTNTVLLLEPFDTLPYLPKYGTAAKDSPFVGSRKLKRFHSKSCRLVAKISDADRLGFDTGIDARFYGFSTCRACSP